MVRLKEANLEMQAQEMQAKVAITETPEYEKKMTSL